jgi:nitroreductase
MVTDWLKGGSMEFYEAVEARRSIRSFSDSPVDEQKIERILNAAILAPSANNVQEARFLVITDKQAIGRLSRVGAGQPFIAHAPVVIICCADSNRSLMSCGHPRYAIDIGIALEHVALAAVAEGLGGCWIGAFDPDAVRSMFGIPPDIEVVELYAMGYPKDERRPARRRKPFDQVVCYDTWSLSG